MWPKADVAGVYGLFVEVPASTDQVVFDRMARHARSDSRSDWLDWTTFTGRDAWARHGISLRTALLERFGGFDESLTGHDAVDVAHRLLRHGYRFASISPRASRGRYLAFCSSVPKSRNGSGTPIDWRLITSTVSDAS